MQRSQIRQLLKKKDAGKIDSYLVRAKQKKQRQTDLENMLQLWTHCLLYHKQIYPSQAFTQRSVYGQEVYIATSRTLVQYLDTFFNDLRPQLSHLNHLQIAILDPQGTIVEANTLYLQPEALNQLKEEQKQMNQESRLPTIHQIEIKAFLQGLPKQFKRGFVCKEGTVTFKFRVGYRVQDKKEGLPNSMIEQWVKRQKQEGRASILSSLKSPHLNLIYQLVQ